MDRMHITSYSIVAALICHKIGQAANIELLDWIGLSIVIISCIWNIIHWKENNMFLNYASTFMIVLFLVFYGLSLMSEI